MYGLLLQTIYEQLRTEYGEEVLQKIRAKANVPQQAFTTHKTYSETIIPRLARAACEITGVSQDDIMADFGRVFVRLLDKNGYDRILNVLGRDMRDFLSGLDNLHEYMKFSYPQLKPPSFSIEDESADGLILHYRSKRKKFLHYVMGQIKEVGLHYYNEDVGIEVIKDEDYGGVVHVVFRLFFDNKGFKNYHKELQNIDNERKTLPSSTFFKMFPFHLVFDKSLIVQSVGDSLKAIMADIEGTQLDDIFTMVRPHIEFTWDMIRTHRNNTFEFMSLESLKKRDVEDEFEDESLPAGTDFETMSATSTNHINRDECLHLRGQIIFVQEWDAALFLGTPVLADITDMFRIGLYINDFSICDSTRDLIMAGTQQSVELKLLLDQEQQKSRKLEDSMNKLDQYKKHSDALLYQMIPKSVADRLRQGQSAVQTCEVFKSVTVMFSDVVGFDAICSNITPMEVVSMLNAMYTKFDQLSEKHHVYKVETVADSYMVVSGAPVRNNSHAQCCAEMALDMLSIAHLLKDPSSGGHMQLRVGMHSGSVVAGVVGLKMPRYCLFGDTVNTSSRMESNGEAMKIHISETTKHLLSNETCYATEHRGSIEVKGKGEMKTYWLTNTVERSEPQLEAKNEINFFEDELQVRDGRGSPRSVYTPVTFEDLHTAEKDAQLTNGTIQVSELISSNLGALEHSDNVEYDGHTGYHVHYDDNVRLTGKSTNSSSYQRTLDFVMSHDPTVGDPADGQLLELSPHPNKGNRNVDTDPEADHTFT